MADLIKLKKGPQANLPNLNLAEPAFTTDEERLYIGGLNGNVPLPNKQDIDTINSHLAEKAIDIRSFGAYGDGIHDDTEAFNRAIIAAAQQHRKINLGSGNYYIDNVAWKSGIIFESSGEATITIKSMLNLENVIYVKFENVTFTCKQEDNDESKPLIRLYDSHAFLFTNCKFKLGFITSRTFLYGARTYYGRFNNCEFRGYLTRDADNCMVYDGVGCELALFNSNVFNDCVFTFLKYGVKVVNTQFLLFKGCNFEHTNTKGVYVYADRNYSATDTTLNSGVTDSIIIDGCYFETVWNPVINPVTWNYTTRWVNNCSYIEFGTDTRNCKVSNSYFARPSFDARDIRTLSFKSIIDNGRDNHVDNIGTPHEDLITTNSAITLLNANSELQVKDTDGLPLGCFLDDGVAITDVAGRNFSFITGGANTGLHYMFSPIKSTADSCFLIKLKTNGAVKLKRTRYIPSGSTTEINIPATTDVVEFAFDDRVFSSGASAMNKGFLYAFEILSLDSTPVTVSIDYIKVLDKKRPYTSQIIIPDVVYSPTLLSNKYKLSITSILTDKIKDNLIIDSIGNTLNVPTGIFTKGRYIKNIYGQSMFSSLNANVSASYDDRKKETTLTLANSSLSPAVYGYSHIAIVPDGIFEEDSTIDVILYAEMKVVNPINTFKGYISLDTYHRDGSTMFSTNPLEISSKFYMPITLKATITSNVGTIRIPIACSAKAEGDTGSVKFKNVKLMFIGNPKNNAKISSKPTTGIFQMGDTFLNSVPVAGGYKGIICTTGGQPGVWKGYGQIES